MPIESLKTYKAVPRGHLEVLHKRSLGVGSCFAGTHVQIGTMIDREFTLIGPLGTHEIAAVGST